MLVLFACSGVASIALRSNAECLLAGGNSETCMRGGGVDPVAELVTKSFVDAFGTQPKAVFLAPGRVNLVIS